MKDFTNKVVWITGASSGIGRALAETLSKQQPKLVLSARNERKLEEIHAICTGNGAEVMLQPLDLARPKDFEEVVANVLQQYGCIDLLINNGGISQRSLAHETSWEVDQKLMEVNYLGTVALTKTVLPSMLERRSGQIAVISSLVGRFGSPYRSGYSASKHALHGFFDSLRAEVDDQNIGINIICPGFVATNVSINALTKDGTSLNEMDQATQNGLSPEKCAAGIMQALRKNKREAYIGNREIVGVYLNRFFPGLFAWYLKRAKVR